MNERRMGKRSKISLFGKASKLLMGSSSIMVSNFGEVECLSHDTRAAGATSNLFCILFTISLLREIRDVSANWGWNRGR